MKGRRREEVEVEEELWLKSPREDNGAKPDLVRLVNVA